ncbi:MAG: ATP-binding protein [Ruminococcus sp.]|nr:ATP-binding protein [Ruminococcus sp.]
MQKKIYRGTIFIVMTSMIIFSIIFEYIGYLQYNKECQKELQFLSKTILMYQDDFDTIDKDLKSVLDYKVRITFIDFKGNVLYDNTSDISKMENHYNRKEFQEALNNGYGEDIRVSKSIGDDTYYYAIKLDTGVVRLSRSIDSILTIFLKGVPLVILVFGIMVIVVTIFSMSLSEKIVKPINTLVSQFDIFNQYDEQVPKTVVTEYSELQPIAETIEKLMNRTQKYIQNIKEQKDRIRLITDNMVEGMIILDDKNDILSVNKSAISILNPDFKIKENRMFLELTRNKTLVSIIYDDIKREKNITEIIEIKDNYYRAYINKAENINGTIILLVDVTETVKAEAVRRDFSANVSHELKTPLTTIKGFGELFENGLLVNVEDIKKYGGMIERESERLLFLINDIIRLSEIEEKTEKILSPINLYDCAEYAINLLKQKASTKDISIIFNGTDIIVNGHEGYMNELFINLIDNAIKYNKDGGYITVNLSENNKFANISIEDTGIGISPQDCERIFERFYRVDKSHSKKIGGTGLGLSIVKHIVNYHNGQIHIESELGKGTKLSIDIPKTNSKTI